MDKFIKRLVIDAGSLLMRNFLRPRVVSNKTYRDIVTNVDLLVERMIIKRIKSAYPSHSILSEETGLIKGQSSEYLWVIDPLDGTVNFTAGIPLFSVSIGLIYKGRPVKGVVYAPYLKELFGAEKGKGAYLNSKKIKPSSNDKLANAIVHVALSAHYSKKLIEKNWLIVKKLPGRVRGVRMLDSGALTSCYVACGRIDGKFSIKTDPFGNAASTLIIEEAGGVVTDFKGRKWNVNMKDMICSNKLLYRKFCSFIK